MGDDLKTRVARTRVEELSRVLIVSTLVTYGIVSLVQMNDRTREPLKNKFEAIVDTNHDGKLSFQEMVPVYEELGIKYDLNRGLPSLTVPQMETYLRKHNITLDDKMK